VLSHISEYPELPDYIVGNPQYAHELIRNLTLTLAFLENQRILATKEKAKSSSDLPTFSLPILKNLICSQAANDQSHEIETIQYFKRHSLVQKILETFPSILSRFVVTLANSYDAILLEQSPRQKDQHLELFRTFLLLLILRNTFPNQGQDKRLSCFLAEIFLGFNDDMLKPLLCTCRY
jgi:hypothetical protein